MHTDQNIREEADKSLSKIYQWGDRKMDAEGIKTRKGKKNLNKKGRFAMT